MHEVRSTREIDAPKPDIWRVLDDFDGVADFNPAVNSATIVAGPDTGEGATRECVLDEGGRITETIVEYEPGSSFTIEFADLGDMGAFVKEFVTVWSVAELDDSRSTVTLKGRYTPKYGPVGWMMAKVVMNSMIEKLYEEALDGLAEYVEEEQYESDASTAESASG
jgi:carbon monoxide dehydrogenase subunit G